MSKFIVVSFGGGTNSTAMLIGMKQHGIIPNLILFADTGGEKPHTYEHIKIMNKWLLENSMPTITVVRNEKPSRLGSLEQYCLHHKCLPSVAYGWKTCSLMFKKEPQDEYLKKYNITDFEKWIGFDADEHRRAKHYDGNNYYPLIDWEYGRNECIEIIHRAGIQQPGKSSCFFCPNSKISEVKELGRVYPLLADRAIKIEKNANLLSIKGLGRNYSWSNLLSTNDMFCEDIKKEEMPCDCYDGD